MPISQVTVSKGRLQDIQANIATWLRRGPDELVIVDYGCPEHTARWLMASEHARDPRLTVLRLGADVTGPWYNHGLARNMGARVARHDWLLFLDADVTASDAVFERLRTEDATDSTDPEEGSRSRPVPDLVTHRGSRSGAPLCFDPHRLSRLPEEWCLGGQLAIRNWLFWSLNGFQEDNPRWGGETFDLCLRALDSGESFRAGFFPDRSLRHREHGDHARERFQPRAVAGRRPSSYRSSWAWYARRREGSPRAQPGRVFAVDFYEKKINQLPRDRQRKAGVLLRNGQLHTWHPEKE